MAAYFGNHLISVLHAYPAITGGSTGHTIGQSIFFKFLHNGISSFFAVPTCRYTKRINEFFVINNYHLGGGRTYVYTYIISFIHLLK